MKHFFSIISIFSVLLVMGSRTSLFADDDNDEESRQEEFIDSENPDGLPASEKEILLRKPEDDSTPNPNPGFYGS